MYRRVSSIRCILRTLPFVVSKLMRLLTRFYGMYIELLGEGLEMRHTHPHPLLYLNYSADACIGVDANE